MSGASDEAIARDRRNLVPDPSWERRRLDELRDLRIDRIEQKVDAISRQFYIGIGVLSIVVMLANIIGPVVAEYVVRTAT
jgi:hypothetical protein